ncbi:hypothetical protein K501DRAFT_330064 [Backusella circina FSU 941]|nr:hypothetical protein K501DRAFT_330064 [Backusella circina FSU 941]
MATETANNNESSASKRLSGLYTMAKKTLNDAQQSFNNKSSAPKADEPAKSSTNTNVKDFVQRVKSLRGNNANKKAPVPPPKDNPSGSTSNQILDDLKKGANIVSQKVKDLTADTGKQAEQPTEKEPLKRRVTRLVNNAASTINKKTAKA